MVRRWFSDLSYLNRQAEAFLKFNLMVKADCEPRLAGRVERARCRVRIEGLTF
jgi:hypothetical protein